MSKQTPQPRKTGVLHLFKKWPLWIAVGLMMLAMVAYVVTLDESEDPINPNGPVPLEVPADAP